MMGVQHSYWKKITNLSIFCFHCIHCSFKVFSSFPLLWQFLIQIRSFLLQTFDSRKKVVNSKARHISNLSTTYYTKIVTKKYSRKLPDFSGAFGAHLLTLKTHIRVMLKRMMRVLWSVLSALCYSTHHTWLVTCRVKGTSMEFHLGLWRLINW